MSVTFHLYQPNRNVTFLGEWWMQEDKAKELNELYQRGVNGDDTIDLSVFDVQKWSDGKDHRYINLTHEKSYLKNFRGGLKMLNRLEKYRPKTFYNRIAYCRYLALDEVEYRQGWFLKKKFFRKKYWTIWCTTKQELEDFFNRYLDWNDEWGRECAETFLSKWTDGMLFACYW